MSRIRILGASLAALAVSTGAALAADLPVYSAPAPASVYSPISAFNWGGAYVGGVLGYGWGTASGAGGSRAADGATGGVYGGFNFVPAPGFVLGLESDILASGMSGKSAGVTVSNPWDATFRARAGFAFDRFLLYGTGGVSVGEISVKGNGSNVSETQTGWTLGAGAEAAITNNVVGRLEYRYTDYGNQKYGNNKIDFNSSQVLAGIGVKF